MDGNPPTGQQRFPHKHTILTNNGNGSVLRCICCCVFRRARARAMPPAPKPRKLLLHTSHSSASTVLVGTQLPPSSELRVVGQKHVTLLEVRAPVPQLVPVGRGVRGSSTVSETRERCPRGRERIKFTYWLLRRFTKEADCPYREAMYQWDGRRDGKHPGIPRIRNQQSETTQKSYEVRTMCEYIHLPATTFS